MVSIDRIKEILSNLRSKADLFNKSQIVAELVIAVTGWSLTGATVNMRVPLVKWKLTVSGVAGALPVWAAFIGIIVVLLWALTLSFSRDVYLESKA